MIPTLLRRSWLNLRRDRVALGLTFVLPIIFFSIFAAIFGGMGSGGDGPSAIRVLVADADGTDVSRKFLEALAAQDALDVRFAPRATEEEPDPTPFTAETARHAVRTGGASAAVIVPEGFGEAFGSFGGDGAPIRIIHDPSNPLALYTVQGLIQASAMTAAPDVLMERGLGQLESAGGLLTDEQRAAVDEFLPFLRGERPWEELAGEDPAAGGGGGGGGAGGDADGGSGFTGLVQTEAISARAAEDRSDPNASSIISYYAAGIGVMFLLFSMAGAAGSLLEEEERGTLERVLGSNVGMGRLLVSDWLFFSIVGVAQLTVMFVFGALVFGLDLFTPNHLAGFAAMTAVTATAAAAFGIVLATICRSRAQLSGISTVVILVMSALGGSMVPRFIMPAFMKTTSLFTFNGWALEGYLRVFWYDDPNAGILASIAPLLGPMAVLAGLTIVFLVAARLLARRWERA